MKFLSTITWYCILPFQITPTIEDASVFKHIEELLKKK